MGRITVETELCKGCGICVVHCPKKCLSLSKSFNAAGNYYCVQTDADKCIACKICGIMCPDSAISVYK